MSPHEFRKWETLWRSDVYRLTGTTSTASLLRLLLRSRTFRPVFTARLCQSVDADGVAGRAAHFAFRQAHKWVQNAAGVDLPWEAELGPGFVIAHGWGIVVSPDAEIGANVTLFHGVTLGRKDDLSDDGSRTVGGSPILENGVWVGPNAVVVGPVRIGENARIAGGAVVVDDVPANAIVAGNPARVIRNDAPPDIPNAWRVERLEPAADRPPQA